jgi:tetratricopeptide (TPR) repeat protein
MIQKMLHRVFCSSMAVLLAIPLAAAPNSTSTEDRASAYYHFTLGHMYAELAGMFQNRTEYLSKAISNYKQAIKADPNAKFLSEELSELYLQAGKIREAVSEAEERLRQDPDDLEARRLLGRIYARMIGDVQERKINEQMLRQAIEQYDKITQKDSSDIDSWMMLGRLYRIARNSVVSEKAYKKVLELEPNNEDALTGLAMMYSDVGDTRGASEMLKRVTDRNPSPRTLNALATTYEQMREYPLAAEALRKALKIAPDNFELKRSLAQNLMLAGGTDESLQLFQELAKVDPKDVQVRLRLSQLYRQQRNFAKAREEGDKAQALDPDNVEIRYNQVNLLEAEGKYDEAIRAMTGILDSTSRKTYEAPERSNRIILLERLGLLYRAKDQYDKAIETFQQIAALDPDLGARSTAQVIETYRQAKNFTKAEEAANAAHEKYPNDRMVALMRASVLSDIGKVDQAAAELRKLLNGKDDRETYLALAQTYDRGKKYAEMAKALDRAEKLSDSNDDKEGVLFMRGAMFEKLKKFDLAEAEFRKVLALNPRNSSALNYLGYMFADRNVKLEEAHTLIHQALEFEPQNGAFLDSMGWVYFRMGKMDEAESYLLRALERVTHDPAIHDHLGDVYFKLGRLKDAISQWQFSLKAWEGGAPSEVDHGEVAKVQKKLDGAKVRLAKESRSGRTKEQ